MRGLQLADDRLFVTVCCRNLLAADRDMNHRLRRQARPQHPLARAARCRPRAAAGRSALLGVRVPECGMAMPGQAGRPVAGSPGGAPGYRYETTPGGAWNGSWNGEPGIPALPVLSVRFPGSSLQLMRAVDGDMVMVRRTSTVRFRNGAPGYGQFSNDTTSGVERALETLLSSHSSESSHGTAVTRAAGAEGSRRRAVSPGALRTWLICL